MMARMDTFSKAKSAQDERTLARVWEIVNALPQREAIRESDARAWVDAVVGQHGEMAIWHAIRLNGFGGSEIGVLVRNFNHERADHGMSARDIVEAKLMRRAPLEDSAHLRRGHDNEALHAQRFYAKWGAQRDEQVYERLKSAKGTHVWMRYSPDDVVRMPLRMTLNDQGQVRLVRTREANSLWLIDYKAPSVVDPSDKVAFQYAAQLHQGAILCAQVGLQLDGLMLSQFDWAGWALKDDVVPWDPALGQAIVDAGEHYWGFVQRGELPPYVVRPLLEGGEAYAHEMADLARQYAALAALADAAKERAEQLRERLLAPLGNVRLGAARVEFVDPQDGSKLMTMTANRLLDKDLAQQVLGEDQLRLCEKPGPTELDAQAMADYLTHLGVDLAQFRKRKLDADKVFALAARMGLDPERLVREQPILRVAPHVKEAMREFIEQSYPSRAHQVGEEEQEAALPEQRAA